MKIDSISFNKFLGLKKGASFSTQLPRDICILLAPNGSGKSILLEQIAHSANSAISPSLIQMRREIESYRSIFFPLHISIKYDSGTTFEVNFNDKNQNPLAKHISGPGANTGRLIYLPSPRTFFPNHSGSIPDVNFQKQRLSIFDDEHSREFERILANFSNKTIQAKHHNLPAVPETISLERIKKAFAIIFPNIELTGALGSRFIAKKGESIFSIDKLSNGERQALILITFIAKEENLDDSVLIIDEPEAGFASEIRKKLVPAIRSLSSTLQIIITTHSSEIVESVSPENIIPLD